MIVLEGQKMTTIKVPTVAFLDPLANLILIQQCLIKLITSTKQITTLTESQKIF